MNEQKWKSHSFENYFGKRSDHKSVTDGLGVPLGNRANSVNHYQKTEDNWKKDMKALKKQNKMLLIMAKKYGLRREIKKVKKIKAKSSYNCLWYNFDFFTIIFNFLLIRWCF